MERAHGQVSNLDPRALAAALQQSEGVSADPTLDAALDQLVGTIAEVFRVSGAGLMFLDESRALRYVASSDEPGRVLEKAQVELGYGPCVDSLVHDRHVMSEDVATDDRWPGLGEIVAPAGVHAVLGVPAHVAGVAIGSLNVYYDRPHGWDQSEVAGLTAFNSVIERLVEQGLLARQQGETVSQLEHALGSRVVIERAVGLLMEREKVDAVAAFDLLRRAARESRRKVPDVAEELLSGKPLPAKSE